MTDSRRALDTTQKLFPVYEFRPLPDSEYGPWLRYADGEWLKDDGEHDVAFINNKVGPPICLYVDLPYRKNIIWSWRNKHWAAYEPLHAPKGNPWHYMLRPGKKEWGGDWGRDKHANTIVGRAAMNYLSSQRGCANGRGPAFHVDDPYIKLGLLRERESKTVVVIPDTPVCMYCGVKWAEKIAA